MVQHIFILPRCHQPLLSGLRTLSGLFIAETPDVFWLRYSSTKPLPLPVVTLPTEAHFIVDNDRLLFRENHIAPEARLPDLEWMPLYRYIQLLLPIPAFPRTPTLHVPVQWQPTSIERLPGALLTNWQNWQNWVETAPETRLQRLQYAAHRNHQVLITGTPLPPIEGLALWEQESLLIPVGYDLEFTALHNTLVQWLNPHRDNALLAFPLENRIEIIASDSFQPARRSSVRRTGSAFQNLTKTTGNV